LGGALLAALEKKDGEALSLLRANHEKALLNLATRMKEKQIEESKAIAESLAENRKSAKQRSDHYKGLYDENVNALEIAELTLRTTSIPLQIAAIATRGLS